MEVTATLNAPVVRACSHPIMDIEAMTMLAASSDMVAAQTQRRRTEFASVRRRSFGVEAAGGWFQAVVAAAALASLSGCGTTSRQTPSSKRSVARATPEPRAASNQPESAAATPAPISRLPTLGAESFDIEEPAPPTSHVASSLETVGAKLAATAVASELDFSFETLSNPRPCCHHSVDGHIYISTGMLNQLESDAELAGIVAIEMAEAILEKRQEHINPAAFQVPSTGMDDDFRERALMSKVRNQAVSVSSDSTEKLAGEILAGAGYRSSAIADARRRVESKPGPAASRADRATAR